MKNNKIRITIGSAKDELKSISKVFNPLEPSNIFTMLSHYRTMYDDNDEVIILASDKIPCSALSVNDANVLSQAGFECYYSK